MQSHTKVWLDKRVQYLRAPWGRREKTMVGNARRFITDVGYSVRRALAMEKPSVEGKREKMGGK